MKFETHAAKFEDHEVFSETGSKLPTVRLHENNQYALGIALHKWKCTDDKLKGEYLAIYRLCEFDDWNNIDMILSHDNLNENVEILRSLNFQELEENNMDGFSIYKFSVSTWRKVELQGKTCKKWKYIDVKPSKEEECKIQRLLCE